MSNRFNVTLVDEQWRIVNGKHHYQWRSCHDSSAALFSSSSSRRTQRLWYLLRSRVDTEDLMEDIELALGQGKVLEAMQLARKSRGPVAAILSAGIAFYDRDKAEIKERMHEIGNAEIYKMEKRMNILNVIISIALCLVC